MWGSRSDVNLHHHKPRQTTLAVRGPRSIVVQKRGMYVRVISVRTRCNDFLEDQTKYLLIAPWRGGGQSSIILQACITKKTGMFWGDWRWKLGFRVQDIKNSHFQEIWYFSRILSDFGVNFWNNSVKRYTHT